MVKKCPKCKSDMKYEETETSLPSCAASGDYGIRTSSNCVDNAYKGGISKYWRCSNKDCGCILPS